MMDLLLWRWSTAVQSVSLVMIALFFTALGRSVRMAPLRYWVAAWLANLGALVVTFAFWLLPQSPLTLHLVAPSYMSLKLLFVLLLLQGAWGARRPGSRLLRDRTLAGAVAAYAAAVLLLIDTVNQVGVVQHTAMGVLLTVAGAILLVGRDAGLPWLAIGLLVRGLLAFLEAAAYGLGFVSANRISPALSAYAGRFLAAASSFDSASEWLLALGCVLAVSERIQRELLQSNAELLLAQEELRHLVDRDALTGLANRRALADVFRSVHPTGATLLFFDLDRFKQINDLHGHAAGDETLRRFSAALRESFRPSDTLVRYAGDEFLVVAPGLDPASVEGRVATLRDRLRGPGDGRPPIAFSVGIAPLAAGGRAEDALRQADEAMYAAKRSGERA